MINLNLKGVFVVILALTFAACTEDNPAQQYGDTMTQSLKNAKTVGNTVNVEEVRKSIQAFYAAYGKYPSDLNELATFNGITLKSDKYEYDPSSGTLTEKP